MSPLATSLWITMIGMGLVFVAILLLWGLMEALMRFTARFAAEEAAEGEEGEAEELEAVGTLETLPEPTAVLENGQKQRAAVAAVAVAMSLRRPAFKTAPNSAAGSAWQAVTRANQLNQATHIPRKSRGSVR